jgi:hypothetical protein
LGWKVWKQPLERAKEEFANGYKKGLNLSDWGSAFSHFNAASELFNAGGDQASAKVAMALTIFSRALIDPRKVDNWTDAAAALVRSGVSEINVTQNVSTESLAQECKLKAFELRAGSRTVSSESASELEETAKEYLAMGNRSLLLPLLLEKKQVSAQNLAHKLIADASKLRGDEIVNLDSKKAAEFYRMAAIHMKAAGDLESSQNLSGRADDFSTVAACYFCGREVSGKEINFVSMRANLTTCLREKVTAQVLPSSLSPDTVIACKGCHSAITFAADQIAKRYFDRVEAELHEFKAAVNSDISELKRRTRVLK